MLGMNLVAGYFAAAGGLAFASRGAAGFGAGGELAQLLGADLLGAAHRIVEGGGDEVLEHVLVLRKEG